MVHHIYGVIEEGVFSILPKSTITIVGVLLHVYTYACILAKTGEYLVFLFSICRFVDSICWTNKAYTCKYYLSDK